MIKARQIKTGVSIFREQGIREVARVVLGKLVAEDNPTQSGPVNESWSPYMSWLSYANAGMLERGNAYCFEYAIKNLPSPAPMIEIGSFCGLSTNMITYFKEKYGVKNPLVTCDKWIFEGAENGGMLGDSKTVTQAEYKDFVKETFIRNVRMFGRYDLPFTIEAFSDDFFKMWAKSEKSRDIFGREFQLGGGISFCYIDGNHTYEFARRDFENCDKYLEKNGFILFDDSGDDSAWEVDRVVKEALDTGRYEIVAKNPNYFLKKK